MTVASFTLSVYVKGLVNWYPSFTVTNCNRIAWTKTLGLSLPLPLFIPVMNTLFPLLAGVTAVVVQRVRTWLKYHKTRTLLYLLKHSALILPLILLALSMQYASPSQLLSCAMETEWGRRFQEKDDRAIRTIENSLRCCGFNSLHDRAWPFPSRGVGANACETSLGYTRRCADPWRQQQQAAATMVVLAGILNYLLVVCCQDSD